MSSLFGSRPNAQTVTRYTMLNIQTSAQGMCIPIMWGQARLTPNLIWQNDFRSHRAGSGKGGKGGGGKGASSYTYTEAVILGLCEGPVGGIASVWENLTATTLANLNLSLYPGTATQTPAAWISSNYPDEARSYAYTAYLFSSLYDLKTSATLPNHSFEVVGTFAGSTGATTMLLTSGATSSGNILPVASTAGAAIGAPVSGSNIALGTVVTTISFNASITLSRPITGTVASGASISIGIMDANPADIILDYLTNVQYGVANFPTAAIDMSGLANFKTYCQAQGLFMSPVLSTQEQALTTLQRWATICNTAIFWSGGQLKFVPLGDSDITANGATYLASRTVAYELGMDDFIFDPSSEVPVKVTRIDPADGYNRVQLDVSDRANAYNSTPVYWQDQASTDQFGLLQSNTVSCPEVCDVNVAATMVALVGQRSVFLRNTYQFKLPYSFILLEQGDIVTLTEPFIPLNEFPVRIKEVQEGADMLLTITAEEFPGTVGTILNPITAPASSASLPPDLLADPGNVNPPAIFEPSPTVTSGLPQVWIALSGGKNWGGANIYVSADGTNYTWIGDLSTATQQGVLTTNLPSHVDPDTADTLAIDLSGSNSTLSTAVTSADADAFRTASLIDGEIIAYGTSTATGAFGFALTYLRRGVYGTTPAAHAAGAPFWRLNPTACFTYALPQAYVRQTLYFKFTSFNVFGGATQDIADVVEYTYVPTGVAYTIAPPTAPSLLASSVRQADGTTLLSMTAGWTASAGPQVGAYEVQFSTDGGATWPIDQTTGSASNSCPLTPALAATPYQARVRAIGQNGMAISAWATTAVVTSGTIPPVAGPAPVFVTPPRRRPPGMDAEPIEPIRPPAASR